MRTLKTLAIALTIMTTTACKEMNTKQLLKKN
jgi:hypothetical protein